MGNIVNIKQLTSLAPISTEFSTMSDDYVFTHITSEPDGVPSEVWHEKHTGPMRIDGMMWLLCFEGRMELEINLTPYTLGNNSLLVTSPNSIIDVREVMHGPSDYYALFVSTAFMRDINFDLNVIGTLHQRGKPAEPVIKLSEDDVIAVRRYFDLLHHNNKSNSTGQNTYAKPIARCLIAALVYQMIDMLVTGLKDAPSTKHHRTRAASHTSTRSWIWCTSITAPRGRWRSMPISCSYRPNISLSSSRSTPDTRQPR